MSSYSALEAVIYCKDCKHWWYGNYCDKHGKGQENADWFCADGEWRETYEFTASCEDGSETYRGT